jgi:hypothetical protein
VEVTDLKGEPTSATMSLEDAHDAIYRDSS